MRQCAMTKILFGFGVLVSLLGLPLMVISFALSQHNIGVFSTGLVVSTLGVGFCTLAVILKCASLLFRK